MAESEKDRIKKCKVKLARYCAYRERTHHEVKSKAMGLGLRNDEAEELLSELISENFINEERFAKTYVRDKFYLNKWGRNKILQGLKQKRISDYCIDSGMNEIDEDDYRNTLKSLFEKKITTVKGDNQLIKNQKAASFLIGKGYESSMVWQIIKEQSS
ncbi:MAG: regulatory protein RecX [Bacteroidota bacterium]